MKRENKDNWSKMRAEKDHRLYTSQCRVVNEMIKTSLRGKEHSSIPRFNSRFMKDSLRYKGSVLWNIVLYHEQHKSFSSFFDLRKHVVNRDYFKDFNLNALSASTTRHRHSDFIYN